MIMAQYITNIEQLQYGFVRTVAKPAYVMHEGERVLVAVSPFTMIGYKYEGPDAIAFPLEIVDYAVFMHWVRKIA
jgi:hypothetical protein